MGTLPTVAPALAHPDRRRPPASHPYSGTRDRHLDGVGRGTRRGRVRRALPSQPAKQPRLRRRGRRRCHKEYAFDWSAFASDEFHSILVDALSSGVTEVLFGTSRQTGIISKIATKAARYPTTGRTFLGIVTSTSLGTSR